MVRNELPIIKHMLPVWKTYADGFVFYVDTSTDGTADYLRSVCEEYNILDIIERDQSQTELWIETETRQLLFDTARQHSKHIICLDADEYLDGTLTKAELIEQLERNPNTVFHLQWIQYTSVDTIRVDGPWASNFKDRIGTYEGNCLFETKQMHSTHLPFPVNQLAIDPSKLFIAHLQWLDKTFVAIKQYFWKVTDYVNNKVYNADVVGSSGYDLSVNNFDWQETYTYDLLKVDPTLYEEVAVHNNYRLIYIKEQTKLHNIPNLGDWGYNILNLDETVKPTATNKYKVSAITAIGPLNPYEKFIPRYVDNILQQSFFSQTEFVIVYSEWSSMFEQFSQYPNIKLIQEDRKAGMYHAWNLGIQAATTDYVTNWNVDDIRHPLNLKIKYDLLTKNDIDVAYNYYKATQTEELNFYNMDPHTTPTVVFPDEYERYATQACLIGPDPMWRKKLHESVGYFSTNEYSAIADWEMWIRFAKNGAKFKLIPEILCIYLDHDQTESQRVQEKAEQQKRKLHENYKTI
tara:strand:- start:12219 stop:13775 length:1557 start_codon:yes stop_codon:yes gene_type:complete